MSEYDLETSRMGRHWPITDCSVRRKEIQSIMNNGITFFT